MELDETKQQNIHLMIGCFRIPLKVDAVEEDIYRKAEKQLNMFINKYQKEYLLLSSEQILAIVALRMAVIVFKMKLNEEVDPIVEKLQSWDDELAKLFKEE